MPARPNTVSVTTAPPISSPNSTPAIVSVGSSALRATCRHSTHDRAGALGARPPARTAASRTSSMLRARIWASGAEIGHRQRQHRQDERLRGIRADDGTRPSRNEKTWISTMPSQNTGTETNSAGSARSACAEPRERRERRERTRWPTAMSTASEEPEPGEHGRLGQRLSR